MGIPFCPSRTRGYERTNRRNRDGTVFQPSDIDWLISLRSDQNTYANMASSFDSSNSQRFEGSDWFSFNSGSWTMGCWVYLDTESAGQTFLGQWGASGNFGARMYYDNSSDGFLLRVSESGSDTDTVTVLASSVVTSKWYLVIGEYDSGTNKTTIYAKAEDDGSWSSTTLGGTLSSIYNSTANFFISAYDDSAAQPLDGRLASAFVIKDTTTSAERDVLFSSGNGVLFEDLENGTGALATLYAKFSTTGAFWDMGSPQGSTLFDRSGNGFNMTPAGTTDPDRAGGPQRFTAIDSNRATDLNGTTQYGSMATTNLFTSNEAMAYAEMASLWVDNGDVDESRILLSSEGITTTGLPSGVVTAYKVQFNQDSGSGASYLATTTNGITVSTSTQYTTSCYVYIPSTNTHKAAVIEVRDNTGKTGDSTAVTTTTDAWTRIDVTYTTGGSDTTLTLKIRANNITYEDDVYYITAIQHETAASASAFDANAHFSFGDQSYWFSTWIKPEAIAADMGILSRWNAGASDREQLLFYDTGTGLRWAISETGASATTIVTHQTDLVAGEWAHIFGYYNASTGDFNLYLDNVLGSSAGTHSVTVFQDAAVVTKIGSFTNSSSTEKPFDGVIDGVMYGCAAHGWDPATNTPATVAAALFNGGQGVKGKALTSTQKADYGVVDSFDMEDDQGNGTLTSVDNGFTMTNNGTFSLGGAQGIDYVSDVIGQWVSSDANARVFEQTTISQRPQIVSNVWGNKPGIKFDGVNDFLSAAVSTILDGGTQGSVVALVKILDEPNTQQAVFSSADEALDTKYIQMVARRNDASPNINKFQRSADTLDDIIGTTTTISQGNSYILVWESTGTADSMRVNATDQSLTVSGGSNNGDWFGDTADRDNICIGILKRTSDSAPLCGIIGGLFVINTKLTTAQRTNMESWLNIYAGGGLI